MTQHDDQILIRRSEAMENRRYMLNKKAFAASRIMSRDKDSKWGYIYVSPKGVICTDTNSLIRITLPKNLVPTPTEPRVFLADTVNKLRPKTADELVTMPEGEEARSNGKISVPNFDAGIPEASKQYASITVNAKILIDILKAACEVTDHARSLVRLRLCGTKPQILRIDAHRDEGEQEFTGVLMGVAYNGVCIPGDVPAGAGSSPEVKSEVFDEKKLTLPMTEGRKFRH